MWLRSCVTFSVTRNTLCPVVCHNMCWPGVWCLQVVFCQHVQRLHAGLQLFAVDKSVLMKLRKSTGYTFSNCKKALEKFDNDISQVTHTQPETSSILVDIVCKNQTIMELQRVEWLQQVKNVIVKSHSTETIILSFIRAGVTRGKQLV